MTETKLREGDTSLLSLKEYVKDHAKELHDLVSTLARIPAPSGKEDKRASFCLDWFHKNGMTQAFIDVAGNVIFHSDKDKKRDPVFQPDPRDLASSDSVLSGFGKQPTLTIFMAHMDLVFPDEEDLPFHEEDGIIHCPGIMDNTANLANLMMAARYHHHNGRQGNYLFVCDVGEEGLGNLKGARQVCQAYGGKIKSFYAFDLTYDQYTALAVGSLRYELLVETPGGHSFLDFGSPNANHLLAELITRLYQLPVPDQGHTTYNAGVIQGGTSVNTIAQKASLLWEIRSDSYQSLVVIKEQFLDLLKDFQDQLPEDASLIMTCIGDRPCEHGVNEEIRQAMFHQVEEAVETASAIRPRPISCSTDCNIPLSMGIPSVCVGTCLGAGAHTREEWARTDSLTTGLEIALRLLEPVG